MGNADEWLAITSHGASPADMKHKRHLARYFAFGQRLRFEAPAVARARAEAHMYLACTIKPQFAQWSSPGQACSVEV